MRGGNETILLAEDDPALRVRVRKDRSHGSAIAILEAPTGVKALKIWKENRDEIGLLLTDLVMPDGMTGKDLAQHILQENPQTESDLHERLQRRSCRQGFSAEGRRQFSHQTVPGTKLAQTIRDSLDATN